ncbi:O-antigen chain length regulator [Yersinia mollaretii]|uniref:O-antigen chain length regulator n=1 Tax=Yersinia mollaretii TaxID=33060 RepID=A0AA44HYN2_YERMO|nr:Wzz/FepE/Etk N-terminal domain-containing protein [Yersinia mollaretii]NIL21928.1 O-antigen chain length regulator [Yersinia mollaretii]CNI15795.1 O-antigen chain length determinant [Yersinia mollaretii]CNK47210.1 O-antigen chain length determinant [Yersinia enterocolitica]CQQ21011.1 O-antigen chain length determinant [Yersinia mollaretii]
MNGRSIDDKKLSSFEQYKLSSNKDEIDLIELVSIVLKSYKSVVFITLVFVFFGGCTIFFSPKNWVSSATVSLPSDLQLQSLETVNTSLSLLNIDINISQEDVFGVFRKYYSSQDLFNKYSDTLKTKPVGSVSVTGIVTDKNTYILSYNSSIDSGMKEILPGYIDYVNRQVSNNINYNIELILDTSKKTANEEYQLALQQAENEQKVKIQRLEYAVLIAKAAGLQKPINNEFENLDKISSYPISLGYDALDKQLEIEKSISDLTTINAELLNKKLYLDKINALQPVIIHLDAFEYLQFPSEPVQQDAKKRLLTIIIFGFIGFVSSIGFVLVRHYIRERQAALLKLPNE